MVAKKSNTATKSTKSTGTKSKSTKTTGTKSKAEEKAAFSAKKLAENIYNALFNEDDEYMFEDSKSSITGISKAISEYMKTVKAPGRRAKKAKDPNAPKRPSTGYIRYTVKRRPAFKKEHPKMDNKEIVAGMAAEWKALSEKEKNKYNAPAKKEMEQWKKDMAAYKKTKSESSEEDVEEEEAPKKKTTSKKQKKVEDEEEQEEVEEEEEKEEEQEEEEEAPKPKGKAAKGKKSKKEEVEEEEVVEEEVVEEDAEGEQEEDAEGEETKPDYAKMTMPQLKAMCKERELSDKGKKDDLIQRLLEADGGEGEEQEDEE